MKKFIVFFIVFETVFYFYYKNKVDNNLKIENKITNDSITFQTKLLKPSLTKIEYVDDIKQKPKITGSDIQDLINSLTF